MSYPNAYAHRPAAPVADPWTAHLASDLHLRGIDPRHHGQANAPTAFSEPMFAAVTRRHTGIVFWWMNECRTVTGTLAQCEAALHNAQTHCLIAGWWSIASLILNTVTMASNDRARAALHRQARQLHEHELRWNAHHRLGPNAPVWSPPPPRHPRRRWWPIIPLTLLGVFLATLIGSSDSSGTTVDHTTTTSSYHHRQHAESAPSIADALRDEAGLGVEAAPR